MKTKKDYKGLQTISDNYRLSADKYNIILQEREIVTGKGTRELTKSKVGDSRWSNIAYFNNPQHALEYVIDKEIRENWVNDLKKMVDKINELKNMIAGLKLKTPLDHV